MITFLTHYFLKRLEFVSILKDNNILKKIGNVTKSPAIFYSKFVTQNLDLPTLS